MSILIIQGLFFAQRWRDAANAGQSEHRFRSHSQEEQERFDRMLANGSASARRRQRVLALPARTGSAPRGRSR
jgi:hypothetical protein